MADKPSYQRSFAEKLAAIFLETGSLDYLKSFWETMVREWPGIDRHRLDKYYYLLKCFMLYGLKYLRKTDLDEGSIKRYNEILVELPFHPSRTDLVDSIRVYMLENYPGLIISELTDLDASKLVHVFEPLTELAAKTRKRSVLDCAEHELGALDPSLQLQHLAEHMFSVGASPNVSIRNRKVLYGLSQKYKTSSCQ